MRTIEERFFEGEKEIYRKCPKKNEPTVEAGSWAVFFNDANKKMEIGQKNATKNKKTIAKPELMCPEYKAFKST
jgi:hypothetical protein